MSHLPPPSSPPLAPPLAPPRPAPPTAPRRLPGYGPPPPGAPAPPVSGSGAEPWAASDPAASRSKAATWVAGTGALLLLSAAATFLAVSWNLLGLPARVAIVAGLTGSALLGGHRLRRRLPAVGAVVYHLGALLVPVDVLGLGLQLELSSAAIWTSVGATAVVALPVLAVAGRSRTLAWGGVAGVPVLATGVGLWAVGTGPVSALLVPSLVVAAAGLLLALRPRRDAGDARPDLDESADLRQIAGLRQIADRAAPTLAVASVFGSLLVSLAVAAGRVSGLPLTPAVAGWAPDSWLPAVATTVVAVVALAVSAARLRSSLIATSIPLTVTAGALLAVLPPGTSRATLLLVPAGAFLLVQAAALLAVRQSEWSAPLGRGAAAVEIAALLLVGPPSVVAALAGSELIGVVPEYAGMFALVGAAWVLGAGRRWLSIRMLDTASAIRPMVPALAALVSLHLAATLATAGAPRVAGGLVLAGAACVLLALLPRAIDAAAISAGAAVLLLLLATAATARGVSAYVVAVAAAAATGLAARWLRADGDQGLAPVLLGSGALLAAVGALITGPQVGGRLVGTAVAAGSLLLLAALSDDQPVAADLLRGTAVIGTAVLHGLATDAWWLALGVLVWLLADVARLRRPRLAAVAAFPLVQTVATGGLAMNLDAEVVGAILLGIGVLAGCAAVLVPRSWLSAPLTLSLLAGPLGWLQVAEHPELRAALTIVVGLSIAALAAWRGRVLVAHLGGVVALFATWHLLALLQVQALDVWVLPVALYLWAAGLPARRGGTSSWLIDVPPLLLVAIPALAERLAGGPGGHSLLVGGLALLAVAGGGLLRLGGPLVVGAVLLVTVVLIEVLLVVAGVPTWAWLALGGVVLLGTAALIERSGNPLQAVRDGVAGFRQRWS